MTIIIYILTVLFAIASLEIIRKKRYKVMPHICLLIFVSFIGFGTISILSIVLPYGETFVYPMGAVIFGLLFILFGLNDIYTLIRCKEKVEGVYCGYNTYYGNNGVSIQSPVFEYTYNGDLYREQTTQTIPYNMIIGSVYTIYIDSRHPAVFILTKEIKISTVITTLVGLLFLIYGISMLLQF